MKQNLLFNQASALGMRFIMVLTMLLTIGIGTMWGEALTGNYTKITNISNLSAGDRVVLYADDISKGVTGWNGNKDATVSESGWVEYLVESASGGVYLKDENANNYIASPGSSNVFKYGTKAVCSVDANGVLKCNNRLLCQNDAFYRMYSSVGTYKPFYVYKVTTAASSYTITATSNNTDYGSVSVNGTTITATPATGYTYANPAYTVTSGTATVSQNGNTFTVTPESDCTVQINFEEKEKNIYIDNVQGNSIQTLYDTHAVPYLSDETPATTGTCEELHWHFMGWVTEANKANPTDANIVKAGASVNANGTTYYAVWAIGTTTGGGSTSKQYSFDITPSDFNNTSYAANNTEKTSTAKASDGSTFSVKWTSYQVMNQSDVMQWQKSKGYIYNSTDLGTINSVTVTQSEGTFTTYYGTSEQPSSITTVGNGYFQIKVGSATGKVSSIEVTFTQTVEGETTTTYSDYITSCSTETLVSLHPNGGSGEKEELETTEGSLTLPDCTFTRDGYRFVGWNTNADGSGTTYQPGETYTPTENPANLYAKWAKEYTITYNANGGTTTCTDNNKYIAGEQVTVCTSTPTKNGYNFNGWSYAPNVTITSGTFTMPESNVTITAQWTAIEYNITYQETKGATNSNPDKYTIEDEITFAALTDLPKGYNFTGWNPPSIAEGTTGNQIVTAQWTAKALTNYRTFCDVVCDAYSFHTGSDDDREEWLKEAIKCFVEAEGGFEHEWQIKDYIIPEDDKFFVGNYGYFYNDNLGIGGENGKSRSVISDWGNMYLAPAMDENDAQGTPRLGHAKGAKGTLRIFDDSNWDNLFVGFIPDGYKLKFGDEEYTFAKTTGTEYRSETVVEYNSTNTDMNVSVGVVDADGKYVATNHTQEMRHIFLNTGGTSFWEADGVDNFALYDITNSQFTCLMHKTSYPNIYEGWVPTTCAKIIFVRLKSSTIDWNNMHNQTVDITLDATKNLYTINNWNQEDNKSGGTWSVYERYGQFAMHDNSKSKNWYVHFVPHYELTYDKNADDATGKMDIQTVAVDAADQKVIVADCGFTRHGYEFIKWKYDETLNYNAGVSITLNKDITLYALWQAKNITITWEANGGSVNPTTSTYTYNGTPVELPIPTRANYTFNGWFTAASGGTQIADVGTTNKPTDDVTYYAQWTAKETPTFAWSADSYTAALEADNTFPTLSNPNSLSVTYKSSNTDVATINAEGIITLVAKGTTTITATGAETDTHKSATTTYELTVVESNCRWVEVTDNTTLEDGDEVVITMSKGLFTWTISNTKNTSTAPAANDITANIQGNYLTTVSDEYKWVIEKNNANLTFYSYSDNANYLYCTNADNGVRVGTGAAKVFVVDGNYLKNTQTTDPRYVGISFNTNPYSWRCYTVTTGVIANETLKFYKRECLDATSYWVTWDAGEGTWEDGSTKKLESYQEGETITKPAAPSREGYRFDGWEPTPTTMPAQNTTFTAVWTKVFTITWNAAGATTTQEVEAGQTIGTLPDDPTSCSDIYTTFVGWYTAASGMETDPSNAPLGTQVTASTVPEGNVTYYAVWADAAAGGGGWSETELANISSDDVVVITMENSGSYYALSSANGSNSSPAAMAVTVSNNAITSEVDDAYKWNIANSDGTLTIYPNGSTTSWLYCTNSNSGVRVGTNENKAFTIEQYESNSFLYNTATSRYLGVYSGQSDWRCYTLSTNTGELTNNINAQTLAFFKAASSATGYISSCCQSPAVVTVAPANTNLELNIDGTASTTVNISQTGSTSGTFSASVNGSATLEATNNATDNPYTLSFTATEAGEYTIDGTFTDNEFDCPKYGSAIITVAANPILQVSEPTDILSECGTDGTPVAVTIDSRYLTGSSLTAQIATTTNTEHGSFKICATENGTFATTDLTGLTAGQDSKASVTIYVRYDAAVDNIDDATGTLTITDGTTSQTIDLATTPICGTSIRMTPTDANSVRVTTANGQWTRTQTAIHLRGAYLLQNLTGEQGAKVELTSSNPNFKFVKPDLQSSGTVKYESEKITDNTWEANVCLVYTPTTYNAKETTTITAKVITFGGTTEHATSTLEAYGRSFPETFVLALYTGSEWVAVPADMIAPYGTGCTTGVGNHDPYPITVDDNANPTAATLAPTRAIYKGAARNTPMTNPWTIQFESNTQAGYYLFGSNNTNTTIANTEQATGEGVKWALATEDNITYQLSQTTATNGQKLGYNATAKYMGQYQSTATNFKYDFRILPVEETCTYYIEPVMTLVDYTDDEAKVRIQYDGTNLYQISMDNKANWTNITGEIDCKDLTFTLPNTTYRGKDVWFKPQGTLCEEVVSTTACHIPAPVINNPGDQTFTGTVNQPFTGTFAITGSDLYQDISAITITDNSNPAIGATIDNGTITVTMAAAAVGTYTTYLTFDAVGAEDVTVKVTITIQDLAIMQITPANIIDGVYCCLDGSAPTFTFSPIYVNGSAITGAGYASNGTSAFSVIDLDDNNAKVNATYSVSSGAVTLTVPLANLTLTHRYQVSYTNLNDGDKTSAGLPYANASYTFTAINCNTITALPACPITNSGFTANWVGDATKLNVYTKSETEVLAAAMTETTINVWKSYSNSYADKWLGASSDGTDNITKSSTYGAKVAGSGESGYIYTPQLGTLKADMTNSTEFEVTITVYHYNSNSNTNSIKCFVTDGEPTNTTEPTSGNNVYFNGTQNTSWTSTTFGNVNTTDVTFIVSGLTSTSRIAITATNRINSTYVKNVTIKSVATSSVGEYDVTGTSHDVSELDPNTQYYYTVSDGTNTSNEIAVTTYTNDPSLKFYSDEDCTAEITETTVLGGEETTVYVKGTEVPGCDIATSVSSGYGMDDSGLNYNVTTGAVTGSIILTLTDANTTEGTLTITDAEGNDYVLNIVSSDCPAGFGTMALPATNITSESAQANWTSTLDFGDDKSGTLHLYKNGIVNRELIVNGDFETGSLTAGWSNGLNEGDMDAVYSFEEYAIANSNAHGGSNCLYVSEYGSELPNFQNMSVMYADYVTLTPGTYTMSAWVKVPNKEGDDKKVQFALGLIGGTKSAVKVVCVSDITIVESNNTYVRLTYEFTLTSTVTACPAIGAKQDAGECRTFYLDDVSLMCTSIGQSDEPYLSIDIADLSDAGNLALTDLSGNTEYTYVIQNAAGCSSNPITFQTTEAGAPVITPNDVAITCQVGNSTNGIMTLTMKDVYSDIYISNSCTERITLNTTQLPKEGGVVNFTFTPLNTDQGGETGTCTISFTTKGLSTPATGIITWTVTAGVDPDLPIIDVTDITNTSLNIEHNVEGDGVQIVISRERQEDEIEDNIGEEIFFSKYYEAYMHKKLWAIYNPTKEKISLANTYVWRSNGKGTDWNIEGGLDLSQMGNIESGYIYPNEELIVYTSDQVGECEQSKADMTNWVAMSSSDPALSFSGNDALLLVRKNIDGDADNPPTESVELDSNGDPYPLYWRQYTDAEGNSWWMLDIIGARQNNNKPDITATGSWTWNCNGKTEKGDAAGWYGDQGEHLNATLYKDCGYVLSTNRCLLIRKESVKSGYKAINENIGDMFTLGKNNYPTEWRGAHVPQDGNQEETSCENFTYVGGYDYESYYNAWTDLDNLQPAVMQEDSTWLVEGVDVPKYYCHPLLIEVLITDIVNGEEIQNVKSYVEYKVPIIIETTTTTDDDGVFVQPDPENILTSEICADCDVVIRDNAKLTHVSGGVAEFRNMQVYPTGRLEIPEGLSMQLAGLHMYAKNDEVGYAIINNDGSSIHAEEIIHIKRIDNMYWYPFSLPYDCKISSIRQLNGKTLGQFGKGGDWGIKYYDGQARQNAGDNYVAEETSDFWKMLDANATLKANQGYIIGLFTPEGYTRMKSIYFPPVESTEYSEGGGESKTTSISNWSDNLTCEPRHRGWNFTALPYISQFSSSTGGANDNASIMMGSQGDDYATSSTVYISIPDGGNSRTYTQVSAALATLYPFKPFFVQAIDPTDGQSHNDITLTYSKGGRTVDKLVARTASSKQPTIIIELQVANAEMSLSDNAGVLVSDRYTEKYEIGADLMKMYAADRKPQLFTRAINNEMMAYNALPDHLAQNIPLGIYLPNTDEYTISIIDYASQLSDAEAVYLLYNGEIVANLLYADYIVQVQQAGLINGYSLDIRRKQNTTTNINNLTDGAPVITIVDGQIVIQQLPDNAEVQIIDVLGRVLYQQANVPEIITFQTPHTGVYNVVITTTEQQFTHKTIIR